MIEVDREPMMNSHTYPKLVRFKQRALVLQGGGALGAYEAGAFRSFYDWLSMQTYDERENIFDIVAGTSIGAINASIIVNEVIQKKRKAKEDGIRITQKACWEGVAEKLEDFWLKGINAHPFSTLYVNDFWQQTAANKWLPNMASKEAARRYFAAKESLYLGSMGVFSAVSPIYDTKYFDLSNTWYRSTNQRLKETLAYFVSYPIQTEVTENEPRLLAVSVDVITGQAVTFDSYATLERDEYGNIQRDKNGIPIRSNHTTFIDSQYVDKEKKVVTIRYERGLAIQHILASASVPINFDYQWIPLECDYRNSLNEHHHLNFNNERYRPFWDGGIMSNTPLEELLKSHRRFWLDEIGQEVLRKNIWEIPAEIEHGPINSVGQVLVPNLDVYMINVWPKEIDGRYLPSDHDLTQARQNDITFGDKTQKDELVAELITDYVSMIRRIRKEAVQNAVDKQKMDLELEKILNDFTNPNHTGESKLMYATNQDLMLGVFDVEKVLRVERRADKDAIFNMMLDFSTDTIRDMIAKGRQDALSQIISHSIELVGHSSQIENKEMLLSFLKQAKEIIESGSDISTYSNALQKLKEFVIARDTGVQRTVRLSSSSGDRETFALSNISTPSFLRY
jgi:predicted acylesterase/phospholipase RssA